MSSPVEEPQTEPPSAEPQSAVQQSAPAAAGADEPRKRRKRQWESAPAAADAMPLISAADAMAHARLVAAQTSALMSGLPQPPAWSVAASGLPPPPAPPPGFLPTVPFPPAAAAGALLTRELEINQSKNKAALTRKATHDQIRETTGTVVMIRGRYKPAGDTSTDERPLHLLLQASTVEALDNAEEELRALMGPVQPDGPDGAAEAAAGTAPAHVPGAPLECKVPVEVEAAYVGTVRGKVLGPRGSYIRHIETEAGVRVQLTGGHAPLVPGAPVEPLLIEISAASEAQLRLATELAESLVRSVRARLAQGLACPPIAYSAGPAAHQSAHRPGQSTGLPLPPPPPPSGAHLPSAYGPAASYGPPSSYGPPPSYATPSAFAPPGCYDAHAAHAAYGGGGAHAHAPPGYGPPQGFGPPQSYGQSGSCGGPPGQQQHYAAQQPYGCYAPPQSHSYGGATDGAAHSAPHPQHPYQPAGDYRSAHAPYHHAYPQ